MTTCVASTDRPEGVDVLTFGEALASVRSSGLLRTGSALTVSPVGAELNVAIGLARLGHCAQWVGRVGDDPLGTLAVAALRGEGVHTTGIVDASAPTALMMVVDRRPLPPDVLYYRAGSAGSRLTAADVLPALELRPRMIHVTGITPALSSAAADTVEAAVRRARELGVEVSLDVNHRAKLWSREAARHALTPVARQATVVIASEDELDLVSTGVSTAQRANDLLARGVRTVVVKLGRRGAASYSSAGEHHHDAYAVTEVDSIGAGDAFSAGYLSAWLDGIDDVARLDRGCRAGAFAVSARGDWERSPSRREIDALGDGITEATR